MRGILSDDDIQGLIGRIEDAGGLVSRKSNSDGTSSPYEINANYFDALRRPGEHLGTRGEVERFVTAHAIMLAFKGLPGLYFHSLVGSRGWQEGVNQTGRKRSINREKLDEQVLDGRSCRTLEPSGPRSMGASRTCSAHDGPRRAFRRGHRNAS